MRLVESFAFWFCSSKVVEVTFTASCALLDKAPQPSLDYAFRNSARVKTVTFRRRLK